MLHRIPHRTATLAGAAILVFAAATASATGSGNGNGFGNGTIGNGHGNGFDNGWSLRQCADLAEMLKHAGIAGTAKLDGFDCRDGSSGRDNGRGNVGAFNGMFNGQGNGDGPAKSGAGR